MDQQAPQAIWVHLVLPVHEVQQEALVHQEHLDLLVLVDLLDLEEMLDPVVTLVHADLPELLDPLGNQATLAQLDLLVPADYQAHLGQQALRGLKGPLDNLGHQDQQVDPEALVILDHLDLAALLGHKDHQGHLGQRVLKA